MKIQNIILYIVLFLLAVNTNSLFSQSNFMVSGGLAIPNDEVANIFNSSTLNTLDTNNPKLNMIFPDMGMAYSINAKLSFTLSEDAYFWGGFGIVKFAKKQYELINPNTDSDAGYLESFTSIYPLSAGVNYYFINSDDIGIYGLGNLSYNFITSSIHIQNVKTRINVVRDETTPRLGYALGLGIEIPFEEFSLVIESSYSDLNYIGKSSNESTKSIVNVALGFRF